MYHRRRFIAAATLINSSFILFVTILLQTHPADAHFFGGDTAYIDKYQVTFVPYPATPTAGENSTRLNFSVLENDTNIYNIYSALTIAKKGEGMIIEQYPYKSYEFSDITIPYTFEDTGDYIVTLHTRIIGDSKYQATPLEANFDLSVVSPFQSMLSERNTLLLLIVIPILGTGAVISVYMWRKS